MSDRPILESEATSSAAQVGRHLKKSTTVGLEYGDWGPEGERVAVVGTPGQARFDAVRQSAMKRSDAIVLWLFGDHELRLLDTQLWVEFLLDEGVRPDRLSWAITRLETPRDRRKFAAVANTAAGAVLPVTAADPREPDDVAAVLTAAAGQLGRPSLRHLERVEDPAGAGVTAASKPEVGQ
ncbi:MAG: hypothetical protein WAW88_14380 [Nocardioides sp.]